jgi:hypothetical protein
MEVRMIKKLLWVSMLVLATAVTVYLSNGGTTSETQTPTPTMTSIATTAVATSLPTEASTNTPAPTATAVPATATATLVPATATPAPTATVTARPFGVQSASPVYMVNFVHTSDGCSWAGVAGQVFDSTGAPISNYIIKVNGTYNGAAFSKLGITGMVTGDPYGPGGYEIIFGTTAVDSTGLLKIQVFDTNGNAVSDALTFNTYASCSKNLVIINFTAK